MRVCLFYKYVALENAASTAEDQRAVCQRLGLTGRVRLANEGINGLLAGTDEAIAEYQKHNNAPNSAFHGIQYKLSSAEVCPFGGELFVRIAGEITSTGDIMKKALPTALGGSGGTHLSAKEFHEAVKRCQEDANALPRSPHKRKQILIDTRNHYETAVGTFKGAIDPKIRTFSQFPGWVNVNKEQFRGADVFMFCTGGIRCEKASAYLKSLDIAGSVSQLAGGIHSYLEEFSPEAREVGLSTVGVAPGVGGNDEGIQPRDTRAVNGELKKRQELSLESVELVESVEQHVALKKQRTDDSAGAATTAVAYEGRTQAVESANEQKRNEEGAKEDKEETEGLPEGSTEGSQWQGVNYTFDSRYSSRMAGGSGEAGRCCYCGTSNCGSLSADVVCAVCLDQILLCENCQHECRERAAKVAELNAAKINGTHDAFPTSDPPAALSAALSTALPTGTSITAPTAVSTTSPGAPAAPATASSGREDVFYPRPGKAVAKPVATTRASTSSMVEAEALRGQRAKAREEESVRNGYLCTEHGLLSDGWRSFLELLEGKGLPRGNLTTALKELRLQASTSKRKGRGGRTGGKGRHRTLQIQIQRLTEWLGESGAADEDIGGRSGGDSSHANGASLKKESAEAGPLGIEGSAGWSAFFPLLNMWGQ
jgi:predicted sulfurtransferase